MKWKLTKAETLEYATIGANTLRWFNGGAVSQGIDYTVKTYSNDVAVFDDGQVKQPATWAGILMLVRMGWTATDPKACPETYTGRWVDALGIECHPWQSDALEIECEARK